MTRNSFPNGPPAWNHSPSTVSEASTIRPIPSRSPFLVAKCRPSRAPALPTRLGPSRVARFVDPVGRRPVGRLAPRRVLERDRFLVLAMLESHLHDHREDHGLSLRLFEEVSAER